MKIRLRKNSIRLRLLQSEVKQLEKSGAVTEEIHFNKAQILIYTLKISNTATEICAFFETNKITVEIPEKAARIWTATAQIGLEFEQKIGDGAALKITIEKDFICVQRPLDPDNSDAFPQPESNCSK